MRSRRFSKTTDPTKTQKVDVVAGRIQGGEILTQSNTSARDTNRRIVNYLDKSSKGIGLHNKIAIGHDEIVAGRK